MAWFRAFRGDFGYSHYGDNRTSVTADKQFVAIIYACVLISLAAIIAATGIRGRERWYTLVRITYSLAVGSIILVSVYGYCWQQGELSINSTYIYRTEGQVEGRLGVHVGLTTINLTLTGKFKSDENDMHYNEELLLENVLKSPKALHDALDRGLPQPLLYVIEYFDIDDGGLRFGRATFMAGHFAYILLWTAFAFWLTANILFVSVLWYGTACFTLTGICMILAVFVYDLLSPQKVARLPCPDNVLNLTYGWCFWASLIFGILTTLIGITLFLLEHKFPKKLSAFFLLDNLDEDEGKMPIGTAITYHQYNSARSTPVVNRRNTKNHYSEQWYVNYGFETQMNGHRTNPVYTENAVDTLTPTCDISRHRSWSSITEEEGTKKQDGRVSPKLFSVGLPKENDTNTLNDNRASVHSTVIQVPSPAIDTHSVTIDET